ncbi:MAG: YigZ family protein [Flavobacteriaceae bacterium]
MSEEIDTYRTLIRPSPEVLYKEKKSKFYGYAFPIKNEAQIQRLLGTLRKKHHTANHVCYAWKLGVENQKYRTNDDGEPNNSAGMPIYGQIQSFNLTNTLVAVVRIFGGVKLGVGGLVSAYRTTANLTLENSKIVVRVIKASIKLSFGYTEMSSVMRLINQYQLEIASQTMEASCEIVLSVKKSEMGQTIALFNQLKYVRASILND